MKDICIKLSELFENNACSVLATIITQSGPSPRGAGTKCIIMEDGSIAGSIGGGILEAYVLKRALQIFETGLPLSVHFSLQGSDVADSEMLCGGEVEVFLEPVSPDDLSHLSIFQEIMKVQNRGGAGILATVVDPNRWYTGQVPKMFLEKGGTGIGSLLGLEELEAVLAVRMDHFLKEGSPVIIQLPDETGDELRVFVEPVVSSPVLYIFGGGHVSRQIVPLAARVGFQTVVTDDRPEFADAVYFPEAVEVLRMPFDGVMDRLPVDESSFLVIVTRGHMHDKDVLAQALKTRAKYIGMIGSTRKRKIIYEKLREQGFTEEDLSRVHSPIGVEIGAETPAEIAVSIVAELISVRAG